MSVVLAGLDRLDAAVETEVAARLLDQGDEVRVIRSRSRGGLDPRVYVATGDLTDPDLTYRAAQGARTVVLCDRDGREAMAIIEGAGDAGVSRIVLLAGRASSAIPMPPERGWVALRLPRSRVLGRTLLDASAVALAVDAADDLAGDPRLNADLATEDGWRALALEPPGRKL